MFLTFAWNTNGGYVCAGAVDDRGDRAMTYLQKFVQLECIVVRGCASSFSDAW